MGRIQCFLKKIINREIIMYLVFGVLTTVVNYGVFIIGINISGTEKTLLVNLYAFIAATLFAFITNRLFVFQKQLVHVKIIIEEMIQFFCCPHIFAWNRTVRTAACNRIFGCGKNSCVWNQYCLYMENSVIFSGSSFKLFCK